VVSLPRSAKAFPQLWKVAVAFQAHLLQT